MRWVAAYARRRYLGLSHRWHDLSQKGRAKTGGRIPGSKNARTLNRVDQAENTGIMPLEVQLRTMREYWRQAHIGGKFDKILADKAAAIAAACAPYCHPRLHAIDAKIETALVVMTEDERRQEAREAIAAAFRERPELTETKLIEHDLGDSTARHNMPPHDTPPHITTLHLTTRHDSLIEGTALVEQAAPDTTSDSETE